MCSSGSRHKGFTLVELVVVIAILGIISAVIAPHFFDQNSYQERAFKDEFVAALRYAQKRAVASQCDILVDVVSSGFALYRHAGLGSCGAVPDTTTVVTSPTGENFRNDNSPGVLTPVTVVFDALGRARNGSYSVSDFTNAAGLGVTIIGETGCVTQ